MMVSVAPWLEFGQRRRQKSLRHLKEWLQRLLRLSIFTDRMLHSPYENLATPLMPVSTERRGLSTQTFRRPSPTFSLRKTYCSLI